MIIPTRALSIVGLIAGLAASASAQTIIYSQDFSTNPLSNQNNGNHYLPSSAGAIGGTTANADYGDWASSSTSYSAGNDWITLSTSGNGDFKDATRGAGFALDGTGFTVAGDYTLTFDVVADNVDGIGVGIFGMDFGGSHTYKIDTVTGVGDWVTASALDASNTLSTLSANQTITGTGTKTISFTVGNDNVGDDLIFLFSARSTGDTQRSTTIDNVTLTLIPEPSMLGLVGVVGMVTLLRRRSHS